MKQLFKYFLGILAILLSAIGYSDAHLDSASGIELTLQTSTISSQANSTLPEYDEVHASLQLPSDPNQSFKFDAEPTEIEEDEDESQKHTPETSEYFITPSKYLHNGLIDFDSAKSYSTVGSWYSQSLNKKYLYFQVFRL